jgi:NADH:ubiquinone oxidoreductase subunit 6 (subunit J)
MRAGVVIVGGGGGGNFMPEGTTSVTYQAVFSGLRNKNAKEIRFKFADKTFEKEIPFEIASVLLVAAMIGAIVLVSEE